MAEESFFERVKDILNNLDISATEEIPEEEVLVINDEENGIKNLVLDCENPILIIEQYILTIKKGTAEVYKKLLQMNRNLVHGAFVLDEDGDKLLFRDTLQLENLDENELQGSINALSLAMAEYSRQLIDMARA